MRRFWRSDTYWVEFISAIASLGWGVQLLRSPDLFDGLRAAAHMARIGDEWVLGLGFLFFGLCQFTALYFFPAWCLRKGILFMASLLWTATATLLVTADDSSPGAPLYLAMALASFFAFHRGRLE